MTTGASHPGSNTRFKKLDHRDIEAVLSEIREVQKLQQLSGNK